MITKILSSYLVLLAGDVDASSITVTCPAKFPAEQIAFVDTPAGWTPFAPSSLEVSSAQVMYGPPASYTYAAPNSSREEKRKVTEKWALAPGAESPKWLQCGYGGAAEITLSRPLPAATSECTITRHRDANRNVTKVEAVCDLEM